MSEANLPPFTSTDPDAGDYKIVRKGSVYNITGPHGREFSKFKSASVAGPRWEELTHTPWPYESSAYTPGMRLWELGIIRREHVGLRQLLSRPAADAGSRSQPAQATPQSREPTSAPEPPRESTPMQNSSQTVPQSSHPPEKSTSGEPEDAASQSEPRPATPSQPATPRQHRLMFQENWEGYREPIKPDAKPKKSDREPADDSEDD